MKKIITITFFILISISCFSQAQKPDTTIQVTMSLNEFRALLNVIDANVDSKKTSKEIMLFIQGRSAILPDKSNPIKTDSLTLKNKKK